MGQTCAHRRDDKHVGHCIDMDKIIEAICGHKAWTLGLIGIITTAVIAAGLVSNELGSIVSIITIVGFVGAPISYFLKKEYDERGEGRRASIKLYNELDNTLDALDGSKYVDDHIKVEMDGDVFYFMKRSFNYDFYDSLIFSGGIKFLSDETLQPLQDVFKTIKAHDERLKMIRSMEAQSQDGNVSDSKVRPYYKALHNSEKTLSMDIPQVQKMLSEEFNFKGSEIKNKNS